MPKTSQIQQMQSGAGFIAALDQSGGSTPKALQLYGVSEDAYSSDKEMYDLIHEMRARIATAPAFTGNKVIGAILFEMTMDREIGGKPSATYLWEDRNVVPFLKIDKGLEDEVDGVRLMKPIEGLDATLDRAAKAGIFGTKMRSVINAASPTGIAAIVAQQLSVGKQVLCHGLVPIIEPEVTISIKDKADAEELLLNELSRQLDTLAEDQQVMLKLSLPSKANIYAPLINHPRVMRVVALSGGYNQDEANEMLAQNAGMIASFSRALTECLSSDQTDNAFNSALSDAIDSICAASQSG